MFLLKVDLRFVFWERKMRLQASNSLQFVSDETYPYFGPQKMSLLLLLYVNVRGTTFGQLLENFTTLTTWEFSQHDAMLWRAWAEETVIQFKRFMHHFCPEAIYCITNVRLSVADFLEFPFLEFLWLIVMKICMLKNCRGRKFDKENMNCIT